MKASMLALAIGMAILASNSLGCPRLAASPADTDPVLRSRFLFLAVFEGLWEDGADTAPIKALCQKWDDHFIMKCPICMPVSHAFELYSKSGDVLVYPARGKGLPKELQDGLKSSVRKDRLMAILKLVERYVSRRFDQLKMTEDDQKTMRQWLQMGKKEGLTMKGSGFGNFCPSCSGATEGK